MSKAISEEIKKIHTWSNGLGVYITKEARILNWKQKQHVKISVFKDKNSSKIVIEKINI